MSTPRWRKSSRSDTSGNECVEAARLGERIGLRDSKNPGAEPLSLTVETFARLIARAKRGELTR